MLGGGGGGKGVQPCNCCVGHLDHVTNFICAAYMFIKWCSIVALM